MNYFIAGIRAELGRLTPIGRFADRTWRSWKLAAGIKKGSRTCTYDQWVDLCAAVALHLDRRKVNKVSIAVFLSKHGKDPMQFIPGYLPSFGKKILPGFCTGLELPEVFWEWTGSRPTEWTVRRWCSRLGYEYSRSHSYSRTQVEKLVAQYIQIRSQQIQKGKSLSQFKVKERIAA
jgi:hypothetical protein